MNKPNSKYANLAPQIAEHHLMDVEQLMELLIPFHAAREKTYKLSFAKRGEIGAWYNLARKYDRIDNLVEQVLDEGKQGDTLVDTLVDTVMYGLKWLAVIRRIRPDDLEKWIRTTYVKDTGEDADYILGVLGYNGYIEMPADELDRDALVEYMKELELSYVNDSGGVEPAEAVEEIPIPAGLLEHQWSRQTVWPGSKADEPV